jgi:ABC-type transport system involved in multi-copper enzyme maturation permease subunit
VRASTHTEIYRRFAGERHAGAHASLALARSGIRAAFQRKLPLVLYAPPLIATIVFSFVIYAKFAVESGANPMTGAAGVTNVGIIGAMAGKLIEVRDQIVSFHAAMGNFLVLALSWYGAGLIAEDRRAKAHLLYFARPITIRDYLFGKFLVAACYASVCVFVPSFVMLAVASFASPEWSFVKEQGDVIWKTLLLSCLWVLTATSIVLAISSLCSRRGFALVATLGFFTGAHVIGNMLSLLTRNHSWMLLSPAMLLRRAAAGMFGMERVLFTRMDWNLGAAWAVLVGLILLSWSILWWRTRQLELVG